MNRTSTEKKRAVLARTELDELARIIREAEIRGGYSQPLTGGGRRVPRKMTLDELDRWAK